MPSDELLQRITEHYLSSRDFNGFSATSEDPAAITSLVQNDAISVNFGDRHPNPHILAFPPESIELQLKKIQELGVAGACLYPSKAHLAQIVEQAKYADRPFTLRLALGEAQLKPYFFDLVVLEGYRNDPRYHFNTNDIYGTLSVTSRAHENGQVRESDQAFLQTFGFGYDKNMNRAVAVYLRYLHDLSPEHQRIWDTKLLSEDYDLHPDYHRSTMGHWPERSSIFTAFTEELHHINKMAVLMGRPPLFRKEFRENERPRTFAFLIRPTSRELEGFVHVLDKMISENINKAFFEGEIPLQVDEVREDEKIVVREKGSIALLEEWLNRIQFPDPKPKDEMLQTFRRIRKLRQQPAHSVQQDVFDQQYFREQRELVVASYGAIRTLRLILANHPNVNGYSVPEWLFKGEIWTF